MCCDDIDIIWESNMTVLLYEWGAVEPGAVCWINGISNFASYEPRAPSVPCDASYAGTFVSPTWNDIFPGRM